LGAVNAGEELRALGWQSFRLLGESPNALENPPMSWGGFRRLGESRGGLGNPDLSWRRWICAGESSVKLENLATARRILRCAGGDGDGAFADEKRGSALEHAPSKVYEPGFLSLLLWRVGRGGSGSGPAFLPWRPRNGWRPRSATFSVCSRSSP